MTAAILGLIALLADDSRAHAQQAPAGVPVAIIVNRESTVDNLSFAQLRRIFLGDEQFWENRKRIILVVRAPGVRERDVVLQKIYNMSEAAFRQYWIAKMFRAEVAEGPTVVYGSARVIELVTSIPGAIAFVPAANVTEEVKVVLVDGKKPGEAGYKLQ